MNKTFIFTSVTKVLGLETPSIKSIHPSIQFLYRFIHSWLLGGCCPSQQSLVERQGLHPAQVGSAMKSSYMKFHQINHIRSSVPVNEPLLWIRSSVCTFILYIMLYSSIDSDSFFYFRHEHFRGFIFEIFFFYLSLACAVRIECVH